MTGHPHPKYVRGAVLLAGGALLAWLLAASEGILKPVPAAVQAQGGAAGSVRKFPVFDAHMHPTYAVYTRGGSMMDNSANPQFSLPMAEQGGLAAAFINVVVDEFYSANRLGVRETLVQIDHYYSQLATHRDRIGAATTLEEVRELNRRGKIASILAIEGAHVLEDDLGVLRMLYRLGVREMNLVHWRENSIGDVNFSDKNGGKGGGLTAYGRQVVAEMNRLGMMIDLSHTGEQTVWDIMEASTQPVVTTHSGVRALVKAAANWSDDMIRALARKGGVICVPVLPMVVNQEFQNKWHSGPARGSQLVGLEPLVYRGDPAGIFDFIRERQSRAQGERGGMFAERRKTLPPLSDYIDHIDYIVRLVGADHVGISSDWGGYAANLQSMENAGQYQNIAQALLRRGYSEGDVLKIMGENMLRVFDRIVKTAAH